MLALAVIALSVVPFQVNAATPTASAAQVPEGITMSGKLKTNLYSKNAKVGDPVEIELIRGVRDSSDKVLIPAGARVRGTVTMVRKKAKDQDAAIAVRMTEAKWKDGSIKMNGVLGVGVMVNSANLQVFDPSLTSRRGGSGDAHSTDNMDAYPCQVKPDPQYGSVMTAPKEIDLIKGEAALEIVTQAP